MTTLAATAPYAWPYDGCLDASRLALVVAGAQVGWAARSQRADEVATVVLAVADELRRTGALTVALRHGSSVKHRSPLPPVVGSDDWQLAIASDVVVDCAGVDGFYGGPLDDVLRSRGIDHIVFGGFGYEAAVDSTLRSANDRGYECLVLSDAVGPLDDALAAHALDSVTMSGGIFGAVGTSADLLSAMEVFRDYANC